MWSCDRVKNVLLKKIGDMGSGKYLTYNFSRWIKEQQSSFNLDQISTSSEVVQKYC